MSKINVTCPKCHLIPFVNIKESKVPELEIKCPCSYEESLPLKDYLNVTEKRNKLSYVFGIKKEEIVKESAFFTKKMIISITALLVKRIFVILAFLNMWTVR